MSPRLVAEAGTRRRKRPGQHNRPRLMGESTSRPDHLASQYSPHGSLLFVVITWDALPISLAECDSDAAIFSFVHK